MADLDKNKKTETGKTPVSIPKPASSASGGAVRDESTQYGDEADVPRRKKKAAKPSDSAKRGKKASSTRSGGSAKYPKVASGRGGKRKKRRRFKNIFELMSASGPDSFFKPIRVFGHVITFWPLVVLIAIVMLASGVVMNNSNLQVNEQKITVVGLPEALEGYRIAVLSDMNARRFGDAQNLLIRTLNSAKYDIVLCLGDMVGKSGNAQPFLEFLEGMSNPGKVYFICGDNDPGPYVKSARGTEGILSQLVLEDWILDAMELGAHYVDSPTLIALKNANLWLSPATMLNLETVTTLESWQQQTEQEVDGVISGINEDYATLPITTYRSKLAQSLYDAQRNMNAGDIHISMAHEPPTDDFIYTSEDHESAERFLSTPELILAGHYCGGVWRLPFIGALYVPDRTMARGGWFPNQAEVAGLSTVGETQKYITRGLSTNGSVPLMPFRLFNSPEISILVLTSTLPENMLEAAG